MKRLFIFIVLSWLCFTNAVPQVISSGDNLKVPLISKYRPPLLSLENLPFGDPKLRWKPRTGLVIFNGTAMTGPHAFQADGFRWKGRILNVALVSHIFGHGPFDPTYFLPVGVSLPLLNTRPFSIFLGSTLYWLHGTGKDASYSNYYESYANIVGRPGENLDVTFPMFLDSHVRIETNAIFGVTGTIGYRQQLTRFEAYNTSMQKAEYLSHDIYTGFYAGVTFDVEILFPIRIFGRCMNQCREDFQAAARLNTIPGYKGYINSYPKTAYAREASERIEIITLTSALNGSIAECNDYLIKYPDGKYKAAIANRRDALIEASAYELARKGTYLQCDVYLHEFPNGKNSDEIKRLRSEKFNKAEADFYQRVVNGTYSTCNEYLKMFPTGFHAAEVKELGLSRYAAADMDSYTAAIQGTFQDCDSYLKDFIQGKYRNEVSKARSQKHESFLKTLHQIDTELSRVAMKVIMDEVAKSYRTVGFIITPERSLPICFSESDCQSPPPVPIERGLKETINKKNTLNISLNITDSKVSGSLQYSASLVTLLLKLDGTPILFPDSKIIPVTTNSKVDWIIGGKLTMLTKLTVEGKSLTFTAGSIMYNDLDQSGTFSDGTVCIYNGLSYVFLNNHWQAK